MAHVIDADYSQMYLLPVSLKDWVGPTHPARFIREFEDALDLHAVGIEWVADEGGRPRKHDGGGRGGSVQRLWGTERYDSGGGGAGGECRGANGGGRGICASGINAYKTFWTVCPPRPPCYRSSPYFAFHSDRRLRRCSDYDSVPRSDVSVLAFVSGAGRYDASETG